MTTLEQATATYQSARLAVKNFHVEHAETLTMYEVLQEQEALAESLLRSTAMATLAPGAVASYFGIPITRVVAKTYDMNALLEALPHIRQIPGLIKEVVDVKTLDGCIKAGIVDADVARSCKTVQVSDYAKVTKS